MMIALVFAVVSVVVPGGSHQSLDECQARVASTLNEISEQLGEARDVSSEVRSFLEAHPQCGRTNSAVAKLIVRLSHDDDAIRGDAAAMLGSIGPFARRAVPALRVALRRSDAELDAWPDVMLPEAYSGQTIRWAIKQITGEAIPDYSPRG